MSFFIAFNSITMSQHKQAFVNQANDEILEHVSGNDEEECDSEGECDEDEFPLEFEDDEGESNEEILSAFLTTDEGENIASVLSRGFSDIQKTITIQNQILVKILSQLQKAPTSN